MPAGVFPVDAGCVCAAIGAERQTPKRDKAQSHRIFLIPDPQSLILYRGCVITSNNAGSPFLTRSSARVIAGPTSFGFAIGPSPYMP